MHIKGYIAGLGIAAKVAMGAGIAAAATTGAGAAGVLPAPVQHAMAATVDAVTPFSLPEPPAPPATTAPPGTADPGQQTGHRPADSTTTTTTAPKHAGDDQGPLSTPTTRPPAGGGHEGGAATPTPPFGGGDHGPRPTTTTSTTGPKPPGGSHEPVTTTTTRPVKGDAPTSTTTTTTTRPPAHTEIPNPESLSLSCVPAADAARVTCTWTKSTSADHATYALLRTTTGASGRVVSQSPDAVAFTDSTVAAGGAYGYRVISLRADGTVESHSNLVTVTVAAPAAGSHT
jgi:hypothetical protein